MKIILVDRGEWITKTESEMDAYMGDLIRDGVAALPWDCAIAVDADGYSGVTSRDITDECNEQLEQAADPAPACHKYSARYAAYEESRLGGAA